MFLPMLHTIVSSRIVVASAPRATVVIACAFMRLHGAIEWVASNVNYARVDDDEPRVVRGNGRALCRVLHDDVVS
jgi:non-ribosomal peptide synthetase component E (peptide arylation enzyme)